MKTSIQEMLFCKACGRPTPHICQVTQCNHILHLLLSVVTCGLWIPIWIFSALSEGSSTPRCSVCGDKADNPGLRFALAAILVALLLAFFAGISHAQSSNVYDLSVRPPSHSQHHTGYVYYNATHILYLEDRNGELHAFMSYLCRYSPATHSSQWQIENGRWVEP